ncbi:MAG: hypothetical protein M0Z98_02425 [Actinomycetales bacterium]|nr:hypothetical protein [Actinomycetales bacterium]
MAPLQAPTRATARARSRRTDSGVLVVGTLARLMLVLAVVGTAGYDAISIASAHVMVSDDAQAAAIAGHDVLASRGTPQAAYAAVLKYAEEHGDVVVVNRFAIGKDDAVTVVLRREAHTIISSHLPRVQDYVVATATATVRDPLA